MGSRSERMNGHIGTEKRSKLLRRQQGEYWAMEATLTQQRRVNEEGLRIVKFFSEGRKE